jgi:hypothetical protein
MRREYFHDLSLTGQRRDLSRAFPEILPDFSDRIAR